MALSEQRSAYMEARFLDSYVIHFSIFAGAAVDMNLAEQQARLPCVIQLEVTEWQPNYKRSTLIQDLLVLTGSFSALVRSACPLRAPKHAP